MTARVLRLAGTSPGGRVVTVPIGPGEFAEAVRLRDRLAGLETVRAGVRTVEIVAAGGAR